MPDFSWRVSADLLPVLRQCSLTLCCRKNWTSSWTVLQGSTLLFAKSQGGGTSWVSEKNLSLKKHFVSYQHSKIWTEIHFKKIVPQIYWLEGEEECFSLVWLDESWGWIVSLLHVSFFHLFTFGFTRPCPSISLVSILPCSHTTTVPPSLNFSCHCWVTGGRLLRNALLSPMAALSSTEPPLYVLPPSVCPPLHAPSVLSVILCPQPLCVLLITGMSQELGTILLCQYFAKFYSVAHIYSYLLIFI